MKWIGITGGIGSGKSTFSNLLRQRSWVVLDADSVSKELTQSGQTAYQEIVNEFGKEIVGLDGQLDRKKLAHIVFTDTKKLKILEGILHPKIKSKIKNKKEELVKQGIEIAFYDVPLLYENNMQDNFDKVVVVHCDFESQKQRAVNRTGLSEEEITNRINNQLPLVEKVKLCDFPINNNGNIESLEEKIDQLIKKLTL